MATPQPPLRLVPPAPVSDEQLCRDFLDGDPHAFGELVRRHQVPVYRVARRFAGTPEDAADLAQRAFLNAFEAAKKALPRLERTSGSFNFRAWLLRIAINLSKNHVRDTRRWAGASLDDTHVPADSSPNAHAALERAQARELTRRAVLDLPPRQREVFSLRVDAELPFADIAEALGITETNAKTHFHYAVKRLRDVVQPHLSPKEDAS